MTPKNQCVGLSAMEENSHFPGSSSWYCQLCKFLQHKVAFCCFIGSSNSAGWIINRMIIEFVFQTRTPVGERTLTRQGAGTASEPALSQAHWDRPSNIKYILPVC